MFKSLLVGSVLLVSVAAQARWTFDFLAAFPSVEGNYYHEGWTLVVSNKALILKNRTQRYETKYEAAGVSGKNVKYTVSFDDGESNTLFLPKADYDSTTIPMGLKIQAKLIFSSGEVAKAKCETVPTM